MATERPAPESLVPTATSLPWEAIDAGEMIFIALVERAFRGQPDSPDVETSGEQFHGFLTLL